MRTLGFSVGHDKGAVIIEDGKVAVGITQERLSRIKHDGAHQGGILPIESINYCLDYHFELFFRLIIKFSIFIFILFLICSLVINSNFV